MNGQYLCNRQITVSYAYKKDTKGERHGTPAGKVLSCYYFYLSLDTFVPMFLFVPSDYLLIFVLWCRKSFGCK